MYIESQLNQYDYFKDILKDKDISYLLDPLTGLVSRKHITGFVKYLLENEIPFSYGMIDLDNFKEVNDTYGHSTGDEVLVGVADRMINYLDGYGVAGRYGGDELMFVNLRDIEYDDKKQFCATLYSENGGKVLKTIYNLSKLDLYVTGTLGMATYPLDAKDYDNLFALIDKTLYRGKSKGRNCYIIYVDKLHKDIVIKNLHNNSLYQIFKNLTYNLSDGKTIHEKLRLGFEAIKDDVHLTNMYYFGDDDMLYSVIDNEPFLRAPDILSAVTDDVVSVTSLDLEKDKYPQTAKIFNETQYDTILISKITDGKETYGYLVCTEAKIQRIWQDLDYAVMYYFGHSMANYIKQELKENKT